MALLFWAVAMLLAWDWVRNSSVWSAFDAFRAGNLVRVERLVGQVRWPHLLSNRSQSYLNWLRGILAMKNERFQAAEIHLLMAASGKLATENDRALVHCLLAEVNVQMHNRLAAQQHLQLARRLDHHSEVNSMLTALQRRIETLPH